ncbi:unnamed protein product [Allacma fusca]|uniref:Uncharacterized protein n=1 Tax=Allacma fusca TaxID=39272 RepID=A0A8J2KCB1_9HEXA|nr:unnamed protein product [Allacma fusca]
MKFIIIVALIGLAAAAPQATQQRSKYADIYNIRSESDNKEDGTFRWSYENSDGSTAQQDGYIKNPNEPDPEQRIQVIQGSYSYTSPEGTPLSVSYVADENGFQASGDHLPTPPPIPEAIQKALAIIYANAASQTNAKPNNNNRFG